MSDETEDTKEELAFYEGGVELQKHRWSAYSSNQRDIQRYLSLKNDIEGKMARGEPVFVQIMDERRKGAVGRLSKITFYHTPAAALRYSYYSNSDHLGISDVEVMWDGRKNKCSPYLDEIEYLPDWDPEVGTIWQWTKGETKTKEPRVIPYDSLGQEIEAGQFVCFVHRRYGMISMKFGTVTRMTDKGTVFVKTLKLRDGERAGEELKALSASDLLIVNDKLMGRLMMARLSAD